MLTSCFDSPPQIIALSPSRGSVGVPANTPIEVQFDRTVVPATLVGHFSVSPPIPNCDLTEAFSASPGSACSIHWLPADTGFVLVHPGVVLQADKLYTFTLRGGFADPAGAVNTVDHQWQITVASAPVVRAISPGDGATNVPGDSPLSITFSTIMTTTTTEQAIALEPAIPGTRVVRSDHDFSRFIVFPGHPLVEGVRYTLSVNRTATDEYGQNLTAAAASTFTAGGFSGAEHAVVLAGQPGGAATEVLLAALDTSNADPTVAEPLLESPRCALASGCGGAARGSPLYTFQSAILSPDGAALALVEADQTGTARDPSLVIVDAANGATITVIPGASMPSWSTDSSAIAFSRGGGVEVYRLATGELSSLPAGDPPLAPPTWGQGSELLALDCGPAPRLHIELADAVVLARYAVPAVVGQTQDALLSPDGSLVAYYRSDPGAAGTWLATTGAGGAAPRRLDPSLIPLAWTDPGTLLALDESVAAKPMLVQASTASDEKSAVVPAPPSSALASLTTSSSGRYLAFLAQGALGAVQAEVENTGGGSLVAVTDFPPGGLEALSVSLS